MTRTPRFGFMLAFLFSLALGGIPAGRSSQQPKQAPTQLTPADCGVCHEDTVEAFARNPHAALEKSPEYRITNPCESCHGPGQEHIESGGDASKIISFEGKDFDVYNNRCLECHRKNKEIRGFQATRHAKQGLGCTDCHEIHNAALTTHLLRNSMSTLCMDCHTLQRSEFSKPFRHRVRELAMNCTDCHQPHSRMEFGAEHRMVRTGFSGEESCYYCHVEKQGPFVFEHAGVRVSGCTGCHEPHGSNYPRMLIRATVWRLCLECHSAGRNVLTSQPPSFHNLNSPIFRNCTTCHVMVHGSNFSRLLFR